MTKNFYLILITIFIQIFLNIEIIELAQNVSVKFINNTDLFTENEWHELYRAIRKHFC